MKCTGDQEREVERKEGLEGGRENKRERRVMGAAGERLRQRGSFICHEDV